MPPTDSPRPFPIIRRHDRLPRGFSKSHAMTGWQPLGYAIGPEAIIAQMTKLQQYTFVCAPSPLQLAALTAIDINMRPAVEAYRLKRDLVYETLYRANLKSKVRPQGAFYIFPTPPGRPDRDGVRRRSQSKPQCADHPRQRLLRTRHPLPHQLRDQR